MRCDKSEEKSGIAAHTTFGIGAPDTVFLPANGFPVGSYSSFLDRLAERHPLWALESRGAWGEASLPAQGFTWASHADDLIAFLEGRRRDEAGSRPVTAIGHSIGATVATLAALKRPDLFKRLVLIDPATLPGRWLPLLVRLVPGLTRKMGVVTSTLKRRTRWQSREAFAQYHFGKSAYKQFTVLAMEDYTQAGLRPVGEQFELVYSREWEAWNFQHTASLWPSLRKLQCSVLLLRGRHSYLHPESEFTRQCQRLPASVTAVTLEGGHMLPQEVPDAVLQELLDWLAE